jgi:hypothetical protein
MEKTCIQNAYELKVRKDHSNPLVIKAFDWYEWFWFHTQVWLKTEDRRPYTYIMKDWIYPHVGWFYLISAVWLAGCLTWVHYQPYPAAIFSILSALLWAHLKWGADWIPGQQEDPEYCPK